MRLLLAGFLMLLPALPVQAQTPAVRVSGTVETLDGQRLSIDTADGKRAVIMLAADAAVFGVEKRSLADIKAGDYLASGGVKGADGKIHAIEVRIFPESLRGIGEGQRPWSLKTDGVMTNATVGQVSRTPDGGVLRVNYKGGEAELSVGSEVPIVAYVAGDRNLLKPGAAVLIFAQQQEDGSLTANRVTAEKKRRQAAELGRVIQP